MIFDNFLIPGADGSEMDYSKRKISEVPIGTRYNG